MSRMVHRHKGVDSGLIRYSHRLSLENQCVADATVIEVQHTCIDLYQAAVEPLQDLSIRRRCMTDDNPVCAERRECDAGASE